MTCPFCNTQNAPNAVLCGECGRSLVRIEAIDAPYALPLGTKLMSGAYVVREALGQGGFGITYFGGDAHLRRYVAIKEFFPEACTREDNRINLPDDLNDTEFTQARDRFLEEAQALARFHHPNIVAVYNCFEENGTAYMVMEYLQGKTLQQLLEERGALPEREAVGYIDKVGEALVAIHGANMIHRDITPANVIVGDDGRVVVFDFGLSKQVALPAAKGTRQLSGTTPFGTSGYAPPEQYLQSPQIGAFTDIYALAAMLYHALTGEVPLQAFDRAMGATLPPPHQVNSKVRQGVSDAVMWAMDIKVESRPQSVRDFLNAVGVALRSDSGGTKGFRIRRRSTPAPEPDVPFDALFQNGSAAPAAPAPTPPPPRPTRVRTSRPPRTLSLRQRNIRRFALDRAIILGFLGAVAGIIAAHKGGFLAILISVPLYAVVGVVFGAIIGAVVGMRVSDS